MSKNSLSDHAPLTLGLLSAFFGAFVALQCYLQGKLPLLPWVGLAVTLLIGVAVVWWFLRFERTEVRVVRKSAHWENETVSHRSEDVGSEFTSVRTKRRYFLYTDHGRAEVGKRLFNDLDEQANYELMVQQMDGELHILEFWPIKRT